MSDTSLHLYAADTSTVLSLPYADEGIHAGFPSPAQDYMAESIDLNKEFIHNKETTFFARVEGNSMSGAGIYEGDYLIIDKSLDAHDGDYIAASKLEALAFSVVRLIEGVIKYEENK